MRLTKCVTAFAQHSLLLLHFSTCRLL